ncbi:class I adenylate-forming enzyme family protein [Streptomyces sp. Z26]|uniref:class I adenylate-forming enzyme family protein n=1 Tax=Streptomyces sp. Z26 TaxID=2500177 RepID=UPI000EF14622|nr:class I adenylate-forming enzyme family protein [Streptomyces sp. Z26]RLL65870.1 long-chain fatty acid--CoA ligase [Streptomyces sp. Z26]
MTGAEHVRAGATGPAPAPAAPDHAALVELPVGARVVVRLPNGRALADTLLACFDLGLVGVPLHPRSTARAVADIVGRVDAAAVVDDRGLRRTRPTGAGAATGADGPLRAEQAPGELAFIMFTSGSTGPPKGVVLGRRAVLGNARRTAALHGLAPDRPHGTCLPLYHCNALVMSLLGTHLTGAPLTLRPSFDPAGYFAALDADGARTASIVPALLADLVEAAPPWPERLEYLVTAAAPLTADLARRFHARYGPRLRQGYGLTEAVNFSFTTPLLDDADFRHHYLDRVPPVGLPLPDTELHLEAGEVWVRTPDLMHGYWRDPRTTAATVTGDGWLRTGDLGELRDGLLVLRGRAGERINRGGEKHHPLDVELGWRRAGLTGRFAAVAVDEPSLGDDVALVATDQPVADVREVYERAPLRPAAVRFGDYLTTPTGKPQRRAMGRTLAARRLAPGRYERLLRHAAATARDLLESDAAHPDDVARPGHAAHPALRALAAYGGGTGNGPGTADGPGARTDAADEPVLAALDFLRDHWHRADDPELAPARARWHRTLLGAWPLAAHTELAAEVAARHGFEGASVPWGTAARLGGGALVVLPHGPAPDGPGWPLTPLLAFLTGEYGDATTTGAAGPGAVDRWRWLARARDHGPATTGCSVLRAGRHDLGGVLWARLPEPVPNEHSGATG